MSTNKFQTRINELKVKQSVTLKKLLARYESALRMTESDVKKTIVEKVEKYIDAELNLLETKTPKSESVFIEGESVLSLDNLEKRALQHVDISNELNRLTAEFNRKVTELSARQERIADKIPSAQRDEYNQAIVKLSQPTK